MPFLTLLNWRWILAGALAAALLGTHFWAWQAGSASTQAAWDAATAAQAEATLALVQAAQEKERLLQADAERLRKVKNEQINRLATDLADALDRLRNRPSRGGESDLSSTSTAGTGCTGATLYKQDSEFLVREAARADRLLLDLTQCQTQYAKARRQLTGEKP